MAPLLSSYITISVNFLHKPTLAHLHPFKKQLIMKKRILLVAAAAATFASVTFTACSTKDDNNGGSTTAPTLYEQVGGTAMVSDPNNGGKMIEKGRFTLRAVVDTAILVIAGDPEMTPFFKVLLAEVGAGNTTGFSALSKNLTDFLAVATGSKNTTYTGKSMKASHDPATNNRMGALADNGDFDAFLGDVGKSLNKNGVASNTKLYADLVALLQTLRGDVVQAPSLYVQVGGTDKIADPKNPGQMIEKGRFTLRAVVDTAIYVIAGDPKMASFFPILLAEVGAGNTTGFAALSKNFTDFLAVATGSTNTTYTGKSMKAAHDPASNNRMGQKASSADFDAFLVDIGKSLNKNGVASNTKLYADLVALLNTTRADIVQK